MLEGELVSKLPEGAAEEFLFLHGNDASRFFVRTGRNGRRYDIRRALQDLEQTICDLFNEDMTADPDFRKFADWCYDRYPTGSEELSALLSPALDAYWLWRISRRANEEWLERETAGLTKAERLEYDRTCLKYIKEYRAKNKEAIAKRRMPPLPPAWELPEVPTRHRWNKGVSAAEIAKISALRLADFITPTTTKTTKSPNGEKEGHANERKA